MKKTFKVVMLPTENKQQIKSIKKYNGTLGYGEYNPIHKSNNVEEFHLYILSDEEIKEGDYTYCSYSNTISKYTGFEKKECCKKVIATTEDLNFYRYNYLPQIPESFIRAYIKAYNEGNPITEVDLEFTLKDEWCNEDIIRVRPDNTVIIHQSKICTRNEVIELLHKVWIQSLRKANDSTGKELGLTRWIEENL